MTEKEIKQNIQIALQSFKNGELTERALNLFKKLGYITDRHSPFDKKNFQYFKDTFLDGYTRFNEEKALVSNWKYIDLLFQLSKDEVTPQHDMFDTKQVEHTAMESYLFFIIELSNNDYSRTALSQIVREVNKVFLMPVMILFKYGSNLTLAVINRRLNKQDESKDVLEKVTLIKDISIEKPHRAHIEILFDLSFYELLRVHKFTNFVYLHNAWQITLDTKELNKRFYQELSNWYFWAMRNVYFPGAPLEADQKGMFQNDERVREHNAKNLIRLLTRILFVWFIKEKNLIPEELFDESFIKDNLLNDFEPHRKGDFVYQSQCSKYYRAILQNLFFATLNQTVSKREFRKSKQHMNITNLMRYESYFKDAKAFIKLVDDIVPFMNGGLFECLDKPVSELKGKQGGDIILYEDGFSDRSDNELYVPDYIFFGTSEHTDLSEEFGKKGENSDVKGLINIFKSYKFTITENTPIEEDIALDPELLGRVFENLLASYNPETKITARKQTGSFYTPREIVNYMVDESLKAYLKNKLEDEGGMTPDDAETGLELLIGYNEKEYLFDVQQTEVLINAIDKCKILDPACGSGAFPMGVLHKLVHILHKLDPQNKLWKERQIEKSQAVDDIDIRDQLIEDIETAFSSNELDYGRKLYLIENCIYGVDIQSIATQISKLRFFISLIVDQKTDKSKKNFGIRPLPNLETKFVAANTLIGIEKPDGVLRNIELDKLENKLKDVRHRLFSAKTPTTKRNLRNEDKELREKMSGLLINDGWNQKSARQLAEWDPYDQNTSSLFFDPEWMFGVNVRFDVVIGNPPYIGQSGNKNIFRIVKNSSFGKKYHRKRMDYFYFFYHFALENLNKNGVCSFITTNYFFNATCANILRNHLKNDSSILTIVNFNETRIFESAQGQHNTIVILLKGKEKVKETKIIYSNEKCILDKSELNIILNSKHDKFLYKSITYNEIFDGQSNNIISSINSNVNNQKDVQIFNLIKNNTVQLITVCNIDQGLLTGVNSVTETHVKTFGSSYIRGSGIFILTEEELNLLNLNVDEKSIIKPWYKNSNIQQYFIKEPNPYWLIYATIDSNLTKKTKIFTHIEKYRKIIENRNFESGELSKAKRLDKWWALSSARKDFDFSQPKLICPQRSSINTFAYSDKEFFAASDVYYFTPKNNKIVSLKYILAILNSTLTYFWLYNRGQRKGDVLQLFKGPLEEIPIKIADEFVQTIFIITVDYIIFIKKHQHTLLLFKSLIDAMIYELYLSDEIKSAGCEVLKHLTNLPELKDDWSDEKKFTVIEKVYKELSDPKHPVSIAMENMKSVPEVRIIEGLDKK